MPTGMWITKESKRCEIVRLLNDHQYKKGIRAATDIGGTFTDLVYVDNGQICSIKSHTTPDNFEQGVINTLMKSEISGADIDFFAHGSTIVINALVERKGVKTGLITTQGFRDVLAIARGNTPDLFNVYYRKPKPFIPRYLRKDVTERMDHQGKVLLPLVEDEIITVLTFFKQQGVEAIAICFLYAYINAEHEQLALKIIMEQWPEVTAVASHQISREWREYERTNTTAVSAYVLPPVRSYLDKLEQKLQTKGLDSKPFVMQSNGGIATISTARANPISLVESGPVGGVLGALSYAELIHAENLLTLDIGGTTAKCSLIHNGSVRVTTDYHFEKTPKSAGYPIKTPVIDIVEVGNGGGSIAWVDTAGCLHVGPRSAGSAPGPVAYGLGGREPTTTDANLLTGRINPECFVGGKIRPEMESIRTVFMGIGKKLNVEPIDVARGILQIADASMVNALKLVSLNRGHDPREFFLMAFGGGGGMHAVAIAEELEIPRVIIPPHSVVFSAWGMLMIDLRRDYVNTSLVPLSAEAHDHIYKKFIALEEEAEHQFVAEGMRLTDIYHHRYLDVRYVGQEHTVKLNPDDKSFSIEALLEDFHAVHEKEYNFRLNNPVEVVNFHLASFVRVEKAELHQLPPAPSRDPSGAFTGTREVDYVNNGIHLAAIYERNLLSPGMEIHGPAIIEEPSGTSVVHPGNRVAIDEYGGLHIHIQQRGRLMMDKVVNATNVFTREVIKNALTAIGEEMFVAVQRSSMSPIIYETLDYGTGIVDAGGRLIAQGCGIPSFIGTLDGAVNDIINKFTADRNIHPGDIFITNDPYGGGGTHLSDMAMVMPVFHGGIIVAWTANKAHWTEIGGMNPGSFSVNTTEIYQEGLLFPAIKLFERGKVNEPLLEILRANVRLPDMTLGDLWSGVAALRVGERRFLSIIEKYGYEMTLDAIENLLDQGTIMIAEKFRELPKGVFEANDIIDDDGLGNGPFRITVRITITDDEFSADFTGTSAQAPGSINCTRSALLSAAREVFLGVIDPDVPATEGCFRRLKVLCPDGTLLTARHPAPTSSYFEAMVAAADVMRKALAPVLAGQLTAGQFGSVCSIVLSGTKPDDGKPFILVHPLVGGWGAGADKDGETAQFCVGNGETSNIPIEVQEARYGVHINRYALHNNDGGAGRYRGGKGVVLEYSINRDGMELSTFFGRGKTPPWGIEGGQTGSCNYAVVVSGDETSKPISMASRVALKKDDVIRIYTGTGGGWGNPNERAADSLALDLRDGYITLEQARQKYGYKNTVTK